MTLKPGDRVTIQYNKDGFENNTGIIIEPSDPRVLEDWRPQGGTLNTSRGNLWVLLDAPVSGHHSYQFPAGTYELEETVSDEDIAEARKSIESVYNTPTGEHPAIIAMREREERAVAQGYTEGDVNHYVQPIIGRLRLRLQQGKMLTAEDMEYTVGRLEKACLAELAWLHKKEEE